MSSSKKMKEETQKGLHSLLGSIQKPKEQAKQKELIKEHTFFSNIDISSITPNPKNPRTDFDQDQLDDLASSIKVHGVIQPITVMRLGNQQFQLIAGERRWRASQQAGLKTLPAYIRKADDKEIVEWAIIENLQRENLNPIETALGLQRMMDELEYTQEQVADRVGKNRSTIANTIRLLKLPPDIQLALKDNKITSGHARAIITLEHIDWQLDLLHQIIQKALSVRQTEQLAKTYTTKTTRGNATNKSPLSKKDIHIVKLEEELGNLLESKVTISPPQKGKIGKIEVTFSDIKMLNKIHQTITKKTK